MNRPTNLLFRGFANQIPFALKGICFVTLLVLSCSLSAAETRAASAKWLVTRENMPQIVTPDDADRVVTFAGRELARCLGAIFGETPSIQTEAKADAARPQLHVGLTKAAKAIAPEATQLPDDSFVLRTKANQLCIAGPNSRGVLYGVYALLEEHLGCRWVEPGAQGEVLPKHERFDFGDLNETQSPSFPHRCLRIRDPGSPVEQRILDYIAWQARQRMNYLYWLGDFPDKDPAFLDVVRDRGFIVDNSSHSFDRFMPERNINMAKDEALVAERIIKYLDTRPDISLLGLWMSDGWGGHTVNTPEACPFDVPERLITKQVDFRADEPKFCVSNTYADFVNRVQARVGQKHPKVHLTLLAYNRSLLAPNKVHCAEGQQVHIAFRRSYTHSFGDPASAWNQRHVQELNEWLKACPHVLLYEYYQTGNLGSVGRPFPRVIAQDLRFLKKAGASGTASQSQAQFFRTLGPNYYTYAKLAWNTEADVEKVLEDYYRTTYGPAAPLVASLFNLWEDTYNRGGDYFRYDWNLIVPQFTPEVLGKMASLAGKGKELAASGSPAQKQRGEELVVAVQALEAFMRCGATKDPAAAEKAKALTRAHHFIVANPEVLKKAATMHQTGL